MPRYDLEADSRACRAASRQINSSHPNSPMKSDSRLLLAVFLAAASFAHPLQAQTASGSPGVSLTGSSAAPLPSWAIGPFTRQANPEPVIKSNPDATFENPINHEIVHWEKGWVYNPAAVARGGKIVVLYRSQQGPGNTCSRIGYAKSEDGFHFTCDPAPVYYPAEDDQKKFEWAGGEGHGGCEDPRLAEAPDGSYRLTYSEYNGKGVRLGIASSTDLKHWTKSAELSPERSGRTSEPSPPRWCMR